MKVYINREPKYGPWGGGSKTVNKLVETLQELGHEVVYKLQKDIDVIFCIDPRPNRHSEWYQSFLDHKLKYGTKIIQRVGDLGTHSKPELTDLVRQTLNYSDYFIFPSHWAREWIGHTGGNFKTIFNRPMKEFFSNRNSRNTVSEKPRLVTHHWSTNPKKGFDIYQQLENYCLKTGKYEFTYIGRKPDNYKFSNYIRPIDVPALIEEIPNHDIYVTASREEAGANHVLEALACALPVVYDYRGGSIGDYCKGYGEDFSSLETLLEKLEMVTGDYSTYKEKVISYNETSDMSISEYVKIIENIGDL